MEERGELRQLRLQKMVNYLILSGFAKSQKDVAERIKVSPPSLNAAMKSKSYTSLIYLHRVNDAFDNIFSLEWLSKGEGEMLKHDEQQADSSVHHNAVDNSIVIDNSMPDSARIMLANKEIEILRTQLDELREQLKQANDKNERLQDKLISFIKI